MDANLSLSHICLPLKFHVICFHRIRECFLLERTLKKYFVKSPWNEKGHIQNHRITEWIKLGGTTMCYLVHPRCSSRVMLEHTAQHCIKVLLEYLQGCRL